MKRVICSRRTHRFLKKDGTWSNNVREAVACANILEAYGFIRQFALKKVDLYYTFTDEDFGEQWDFSVPMRDLPRDSREGAQTLRTPGWLRVGKELGQANSRSAAVSQP